jgi:hypothetical protein
MESIPFTEKFVGPHAQSHFADILLFFVGTTAWSELHSS